MNSDKTKCVLNWKSLLNICHSQTYTVHQCDIFDQTLVVPRQFNRVIIAGLDKLQMS